MRWAIRGRSEFVRTPFWGIAVRIDGHPTRPSLLHCQRFRGTMDDWDPEFVTLLARERSVIRFDSVGSRAAPHPSRCKAWPRSCPRCLTH
jgi:hypothetical protein